MVSVRYALVTAVLLAVAPALAQTSADSDAELRRVQAALAVIQQTQQGVYQQFQMVQELRRAELGRPDPFAPQPNVGIAPPPQDYSELQRQREARESRIKELTAELDRLYARYRKLEEEKRPLLERLGELARAR